MRASVPPAEDVIAMAGVMAERDKLKDENKKLRAVIDEGGGCCLCELDRWGIEVSRCQLHTELEALREALRRGKAEP